MWKFERAWPFYLIVLAYPLSMVLPIYFNGGNLLGVDGTPLPNFVFYIKIGEGVASICSFFAAFFYLKRNQFEGDQFTAILLSLGFCLFLESLIGGTVPKNVIDGFWRPVVFSYIPAFVVAFSYLRRHSHKIEKTRCDTLKLQLVISFIIATIFIKVLSAGDFSSYGSNGDFTSTLIAIMQSLMVLAFLLIHLKSLQLKEGGAAHYEKLIDDFGKNAKG